MEVYGMFSADGDRACQLMVYEARSYKNPEKREAYLRDAMRDIATTRHPEIYNHAVRMNVAAALSASDQAELAGANG